MPSMVIRKTGWSKTLLAACLLLALMTGAVMAMPPRPGMPEPLAIIKARDEGRIDNPADGLIFKLTTKYGDRVKISGNRTFPVIMGFFSDQAGTYTPAQFQDSLFSNTPGKRTCNNYYMDMSYTAMACTGRVAPWYSCGKTVAAIGGGNYGENGGITGNVYDFITSVLAACDGTVNFADTSYDQDHDGYVDVLWVIHSGRGAEETGSVNDIWSHSSSLSLWSGWATYYTTNDISPFTGTNVRINKYIIMPEQSRFAYGSPYTLSMIGRGVFCHEFGHALGLPDLYDTGPGTSQGGVGGASGCVGFSGIRLTG